MKKSLCSLYTGRIISNTLIFMQITSTKAMFLFCWTISQLDLRKVVLNHEVFFARKATKQLLFNFDHFVCNKSFDYLYKKIKQHLYYNNKNFTNI